MAFDEEERGERPGIEGPLPPDDRIWRHPSELAGGTPPPAAWLAPAPRASIRRGVTFAALAGACLTGATVAVGVMWLTRPTKVVYRDGRAAAGQPVTTAVYSPAGVPTQKLAAGLGPSLVTVSASVDEQWSTGTGVWLDDDGTIAVASPLVADSHNIMVTDLDGTPERATVVATDPVTGMTVLTVGAATGTAVGESQTTASATAGQPVAVIGAPSSSSGGTVQQRVVRASISAVGVRTPVDPLVIHDALQLDRSLPVDALGSVVVDVRGHLVGIVLAGTGADRLAVVIPASEALTAARALRDDGKVRRAYLGVRAIDLDPAAAQLYDVPGGALLTEIDDGSPAASAGLAVGDVITGIDGDGVTSSSDLLVALRAWKPGEVVDLTWHRGAVSKTTRILLSG